MRSRLVCLRHCDGVACNMYIIDWEAEYKKKHNLSFPVIEGFAGDMLKLAIAIENRATTKINNFVIEYISFFDSFQIASYQIGSRRARVSSQLAEDLAHEIRKTINSYKKQKSFILALTSKYTAAITP